LHLRDFQNVKKSVIRIGEKEKKIGEKVIKKKNG